MLPIPTPQKKVVSKLPLLLKSKTDSFNPLLPNFFSPKIKLGEEFFYIWKVFS